MHRDIICPVFKMRKNIREGEKKKVLVKIKANIDSKKKALY